MAEHQHRPHHCCLRCGWTPEEGMPQYLWIHGVEAECLQCGVILGENCLCQDPYLGLVE